MIERICSGCSGVFKVDESTVLIGVCPLCGAHNAIGARQKHGSLTAYPCRIVIKRRKIGRVKKKTLVRFLKLVEEKGENAMDIAKQMAELGTKIQTTLDEVTKERDRLMANLKTMEAEAQKKMADFQGTIKGEIANETAQIRQDITKSIKSLTAKIDTTCASMTATLEGLQAQIKEHLENHAKAGKMLSGKSETGAEAKPKPAQQ